MSGRRLAALCALLLMPICAARAAEANAYRIEVDITNQITTVYRLEDDSIARQMICSTGMNDLTPRGTFQLQVSRPTDRQAWYFIGKYQCFVKYPTRIQGSILFHSLPYADRDMTTVDPEALGLLGSKASHGCVRLRWQDAKWIAANCMDGTQTRIFTGATRETALRELLLDKSYTGAQGQSYADFIAPIQDGEARTLGRGDSGAAVEALQRRLGAMGWFTAKASGEYDEATVIAVMRCQADAGLPATGVASPAFIRRIMEDD